jgi:hypothetical protein
MLSKATQAAEIPSAFMLLPPKALMTVGDGIVMVTPYDRAGAESIPIG